MIIRINKQSAIHYFLIYFMLIVNQSCLYEYFLRSELIRLGLLCLFGLLIAKNYKKNYRIYLGTAGILFVCMFITRFMAGGIGLTAWVGWVLPIFVSVYVVNFDFDNFFKRFVKVAVFLAGVGIVFFFIQISVPELLKTILPIEYDTSFSDKVWYDSKRYIEIFHKGYGLFLYSYKVGGDSLMRNKGIFTEPGICQMLYNSALIILLFFSDKVAMTKKQFKRNMTVLIIAIVTVQSTTGYILLGCILICYIFTNQKRKKNVKGYIFTAIILGSIGLLGDLAIRGSESFLNIAIFDKILGNNNQFKIQGSGMARIGSALLSISVMIAHPLGIGSDNLLELQEADLVAGGGAGIFKFGAKAGIIPLLTCILFYAVPIIKSSLKPLIKILLIFFIFDILFAQTIPFYPILIMFPIYLIEQKRQERIEGNSYRSI